MGDDPAAVAENVRRAAETLGIRQERLYFLSQVHGTAVKVLGADEDRDAVLKSVGDITLSSVAGVGCGIRTADCVPVLIADRRTGAVAAVHSGWRGTAARAASAGVAALRELVRDRADLIAAIGPHIERCCFEVDVDVALLLADASGAGSAAVHRSDAPRGGSGSAKPKVDLRLIVRAQLEEAGIEAGSIDDVGGCTVCERERFYSYRRDRERSGRMLSAIVARGE